MVSLQELEAQYRAFTSYMEQGDAAVASLDVDTVEAYAESLDHALKVLAESTASLQDRTVLAGEEPAWESLADAMRQAFVKAEENRAKIQLWITQTQEVLSHMGRGGRAVNGYAAAGTADGAEFLSARG
ncbi:MAG: hypothetical protein OEV08_05925 [Nitrospira sp.]|nr:hypothetical protein [Nitrospira sp.]